MNMNINENVIEVRRSSSEGEKRAIKKNFSAAAASSPTKKTYN